MASRHAGTVFLRNGVLAAALAVHSGTTPAQTGPNSPAAVANNAGVGVNAWTTPTNAVSSNDTYSTVGSRGISNYLAGTDLGFNIASPAAIVGIQLDVEKNTFNPQNVALLDGWTTGLSRTISAGQDRCLIVAYAQENGINSRDITSMTYGGREMTQVVETTAGISGGFTARLEIWMLLDADIALAGSTTIVPTFGSYTAHEYCDAFSSAVFQYVDQVTPVSNTQTAGAQGSSDPHQLGTAVTTLAGGMAINLATCGNRPASLPAPNTNTTAYTIGSGFTEGIDHYFANATDAPNTGACLHTAHKAIASNGTEAPACDFNGSVNRWAIIGMHLQRARELDHEVKLIRNGTIGGSNLASPVAWGTTDAYTTYGGSTSLWGQTWTLSDVNNASFGAAIAARVQNGTARIDHMRITVYAQSTLPVELIGFQARQEGQVVRLDWATATENNNDRFVVQRSSDGVTFTGVAEIPGAVNSTATLYYSAVDEFPVLGTNYYRLEQVDTDGTTEHSPVVPVAFTTSDVVVYPNPTPDGVLSLCDAGASTGQVSVFTSDLRLVRTHYFVPQDRPMLHLEDLPDGTYILVFNRDGVPVSAKVMKTSRLY